MDSFYVDIIIKVAVLVILAVWGWAKARWHLKEGKRAKITAIAEEAVVGIYYDFVKDIKAANDDGKLSKAEIVTARDKAWKRAKRIGKEKGIDFAKEVTKEYFPVLIDKVIKAVKK